jgi:hypothetical protein
VVACVRDSASGALAGCGELTPCPIRPGSREEALECRERRSKLVPGVAPLAGPAQPISETQLRPGASERRRHLFVMLEGAAEQQFHLGVVRCEHPRWRQATAAALCCPDLRAFIDPPG